MRRPQGMQGQIVLNVADGAPIPCLCPHLATDAFTGNVSVIHTECTGDTVAGVPDCTCCKHPLMQPEAFTKR